MVMSGDGKWTIPDHVQVLQTQSCSYKTETEEIKEINSYQKLLSTEAKVEGKGWGAKFSTSAGIIWYSEFQGFRSKVAR
jgi:hypothetical protein